MRPRFKSMSVDPVMVPSARKARQPIGNQRNSKRARLDDTGLDVDRNASRRHEASQSPRCFAADAPKTSEYAYFRNIRKQTVPANLGSLHERKELSKSSKPNNLSSDIGNASGFYKSATENVRLSPVSEERAGPSNHHTLVSPCTNLTHEIKQKSPLLSENVSPIGQHLSLPPFQEVSDISGNRCSKEGIFAANRRKLRQQVVRTSFSKVQGSVPNGSDLVSTLLSRLFPKNEGLSAVHSNHSKSLPFNEPKYLGKEPKFPHGRNVDENLPRICTKNRRYLPDNETEYLEKGPQLRHGRNLDENVHRICSSNSRSLPYNEQYVEKGPLLLHSKNLDENLHSISSNSSRSLTYNEPKYMEEGPQLPRGRNLVENLSRNYFGSATDTVHAEWDTSFSRYPSLECDPGNAYVNDIRNPNLCLKSHQGRGSHRLLEFSFELPIETHGSSRICMEEPEEFLSSVSHAREEPDRLLLEWDPESQRSEVHWSIFNRDSSVDLNPCLAIPWHDDYHQMVANRFDAKASCSSLVPSNNCVEFDSIPNYESSSCLIRDVEQTSEHQEYIVQEPDEFSLTLPYTSTCLSLEEHRNTEDTMYIINDMFSCADQHWPKDEFWDRHDSWRKSLCITEISEEDPSSILCATRQFPQNETRSSFCPQLQEDHADSVALLSNNTFDSHLLHQENFRASPDSLIDYPLLDTNYSSYQCAQDMYSDDVQLL